MRYLFLITLLMSSLFTLGQSNVDLRGDSIRIYKVGGNAELVVRNATRNLANSFLQNLGNGVTSFAIPRYVDSVSADMDSIYFWNKTLALRLGAVKTGGVLADNGLRISGGIVKLDNGTNPLTEDVFIDGVTNSRDFGLNSKVGTWSLQRSMTFNGFAVGSNDSVKFDINTMALKLTGASVGDGDAAIGKKYAIYTLTTDITANRTLFFPYKLNDPGFLLYIINKNTTAFNWGVSGAPVEDGSGNAVTTIDRGLWLFIWDGEKWIRQAGGSSGGASALDDLTDVTLTAPSSGQVLKYNGTAWVNDAAGAGTVTNVATGAFITGGPITTTGTVSLDTANAGLKAFVEKYGGSAIVSGQSGLRIAAGILRPTNLESGQPIEWEWLGSSSSHDTLFFSGPPEVLSTGEIRVFHRQIKNVITAIPKADDVLAGFGVGVGATVGTTAMGIFLSRTTGDYTGYLRGNGTGWTGNGDIISLVVDYAGGLLRWNAPSGALKDGDNSGTSAVYVGSNNYKLERVLSGLGTYNVGYQVVDDFGNSVSLTPQTTDIINVTIPGQAYGTIIPQTFTGPPASYLTTSSAIFIFAIYEELDSPHYLTGSLTATPASATQINLSWPNTTDAGSFSVQRSTTANFHSYTTVYSGAGTSFSDTGLTTGTTYYYRVYNFRTSDGARSDMLGARATTP